MKRYIRNTNYNNQDAIFAMANIRGKHVKVPGRLDFSFFFSPKDVTEGKEITHGLRVKPIFNPEKMSLDMAGTLKLHGDWEYIPGTNDKKVAAKDVRRMKAFFKEYKTLFAAVWEKALLPDSLYDYFRGTITFEEMLEDFDFYDELKEEIEDVNSLIELTDLVREYRLFNLWEV